MPEAPSPTRDMHEHSTPRKHFTKHKYEHSRCTAEHATHATALLACLCADERSRTALLGALEQTLTGCETVTAAEGPSTLQVPIEHAVQ